MKTQPNSDFANELDSHLITVSLGLIAGGYIILQSIRTPPKISLQLILLSFIFLVFSILALIWHKVRFKLRKNIFKTKRDEITKKHNAKMAEFADKVIIPLFSSNEKLRELNKDERHKWVDEHFRYPIESIITRIRQETQKVHIEAFSKELMESHASIKLRIDKLAENLRYQFFLISLILLVTGLVIIMIAE